MDWPLQVEKTDSSSAAMRTCSRKYALCDVGGIYIPKTHTEKTFEHISRFPLRLNQALLSDIELWFFWQQHSLWQCHITLDNRLTKDCHLYSSAWYILETFGRALAMTRFPLKILPHDDLMSKNMAWTSSLNACGGAITIYKLTCLCSSQCTLLQWNTMQRSIFKVQFWFLSFFNSHVTPNNEVDSNYIFFAILLRRTVGNCNLYGFSALASKKSVMV